MQKKRLLVFIVAYNAAKTIQSVVGRIPHLLVDDYDTEVLIIDDSSQDDTFKHAININRPADIPFKLHVFFNPDNLGYGGNQKIGFHFAIEQGFDFVALVHGDGQYAPECLPELLKPLAEGSADMVFGSRMSVAADALKGGMPMYKYFGNKILTWLQNRLLGTKLSEFHSGYRLYSVDGLKRIPFELNTNDFHFDTEIIIQFLFAGLRIRELPIPTYYGGEICYVNGFKYAWNVFWTTLKARAMDFSLGYDRKFDCRSTGHSNIHYGPKLNYLSPSTITLSIIEPGKRVLDVGCSGGHMGVEMRKKGCYVAGIDIAPLPEGAELDAFYQQDLNVADLPVKLEDFDYIVMLDIIEHLLYPEGFIDRMRGAAAYAPHTRLIVSTGNVAFLVTRFMLLLGKFHYAKRGILDIKHTRLFTFSTFGKLFEQGGFKIIRQYGVPAPFPGMFGDNIISRFLLEVNRLLILLSKSFFSYQIVMVVQPNPSMPYLLGQAHEASRKKYSVYGKY